MGLRVFFSPFFYIFKSLFFFNLRLFSWCVVAFAWGIRCSADSCLLSYTTRSELPHLFMQSWKLWHAMGFPFCLLAHTQLRKPGSDPEPKGRRSLLLYTYDFLSCMWRCQFLTFLSSRQKNKSKFEVLQVNRFRAVNWSFWLNITTYNNICRHMSTYVDITLIL